MLLCFCLRQKLYSLLRSEGTTACQTRPSQVTKLRRNLSTTKHIEHGCGLAFMGLTQAIHTTQRLKYFLQRDPNALYM